MRRATVSSLWLLTLILILGSTAIAGGATRGGGGGSTGGREAKPASDGALSSEPRVRSGDSGVSSSSETAGGAPIGDVARRLSVRFLEDPRRPGYAIGWATNSPVAILQGAETALYLELPSTTVSLYLSTLVSVEDSSGVLVLSFRNRADTVIRFRELDSAALAPDAATPHWDSVVLPNGEHDDFRLPLNPAPYGEAVWLVSIEKAPEGTFELLDATIKEVGR